MKTAFQGKGFGGIGCVLTLMVVLAVSCSGFNDVKPEMSKETYTAVTGTGNTYHALLNLTVNAVTSSAEKVLEYDSDLADQLTSRSVQNQQALDLNDLFALTDLGKTKGGQSRSVGTVDPLTLEDELSEIVTNYESGVAALAPTDLSFLDGVDGIAVKEGMVYVDDDILIDPASTSGIMQLALIKAQLEGANLNDIIADMENVAGNFGDVNEDAASRGLYKTSTLRWPSKTVSYAWQPTISSYSKNLFVAAMNDWTSKIPGLTFVDRTNDIAYLNAAGIGQKPLVILQSDPGLSAYGRAYVGAYNGKYTCTIRDGLTGNWAIRTPRHELGHTLGLNHEHQRWDRDTYLSVSSADSSDPTNWGKIDKSVTNAIYGWYFDYFTIRVLCIRVRVYYLTYGMVGSVTTTLADGSAALDYKSIMLYSTNQFSSLKAKVAKQGLSVGSKIPVNYIISPDDIATVKKMYP
ncbi:hypothetical protein AGMMS50267_17410 [Spirochaetia bacterium]|nr:hypothetical protein AGMMS50267_17410 [Spirochaetia bacterium]